MEDGQKPSELRTLRWITLGFTAVAVYVVWPMWPALVLAAWTAALMRPWLERLQRVLRGRRRAAAVLSMMLFLLLVLPIGFIVLAVTSGVQELVVLLQEAPSAKAALEAIATSSQRGAALQIPSSLEEVVGLLEKYGAQGLKILKMVAGAAVTGMIGLFVYFSVAFVLLVHGPAVWGWAKEHSPLAPTHLERFAAAFHETGRGLVVGIGLTSAVQGLLATIAYASLGVPRWWVLGPITGLTALIPLAGPAIVWLPISLGLLFTSHPIKAVILIAVGAGVIGTMDNILRPVFSRWAELKVPTLLLFVSIFGGMIMFGAWGLIAGPLVVRLWMEALALRQEVHVTTTTR